jgi:hypothetical protein
MQATMRRVAAVRHGSPTKPLDEIHAALARMEAMMASRSGVPRTSMNMSASSFMSPSKSEKSFGTSASPQPLRPIHGPTDANGNALLPRSQFLRGLVTVSAPPDTRHHFDSTEPAQAPEEPRAHSFHRPREEPVRSTMLRRLEADLEECTFQPNVVRRRKSLQSDPFATSTKTQPPVASHAAAPATSNHHHGHTVGGGGGVAIFDRLYAKRTRHLSRPLAERLGTEIISEDIAPRRQKAADRFNDSQRNPYGLPSVPKPEKPVANTRPKTSPNQPSPNVPAKRDLAATTASASDTPAQNSFAHAATAGDPNRVPIHQRLFADANKARQIAAADESIRRKQSISASKAQQNIERWALLEREKERKLEILRREREASEKALLDEKRLQIEEHIWNRTGYRPPALRRRPTGGAGGPAATTAPGPAPAHSASTESPLKASHHPTESGMLLTPNGTWMRSTLPNGSVNGASDTAAAKDTNEATADAPAVRRPPGVSPLPLQSLYR